MKKVLALSLTDCRNIFREKILYFMFVGSPILLFLIARFALPFVGTHYPIVADYSPILLLVMTLQVTTGIGFVIASIILDERDEGVLTAIRVMPLDTNTFILYRLLFSMLVSFMVAILLLRGSTLVSIGWENSLGLAFLFALVAPMVLLAMASFSANKVEGLAFFKGLNLILLLPLVYFFVASKWTMLLGIIPVYWTYLFFESSLQGTANLSLFLLSVLVHLCWIGLLIYGFKKRVFMR